MEIVIALLNIVCHLIFGAAYLLPKLISSSFGVLFSIIDCFRVVLSLIFIDLFACDVVEAHREGRALPFLT